MTNPVIDCLQNHRSVRKFKSDPLSEETIQTLLTSGIRAASCGNLQLYSFLVVDDREKLDLFEGLISPVIKRPPLIIIALLDLHRIKSWFKINQTEPPVLDRPIYFMLGLWDALIALQNVVVAAESLDLGTCYFGPILEFDIQTHFGTPEYVFPAGMVCVGHPAEEPRQRKRLPLEAVMHRNSYRHFSERRLREFYSERDRLWESVSDERKQYMREQGIESIPQAVSVQRFSEDVTRKRSQRLLANLTKAGFKFDV